MVSVIIPCYKVKDHIISVLSSIDKSIDHIFVIDDRCPQFTGNYVEESIKDPRVKVIYHEKNLGIGAAMKTGYKAALKTDSDIFVKIDGDGQMDPTLIPLIIEPILRKKADYSKGNRFYHITSLKSMPPLRLVGNSVLSFINKIVNGYWNIMDPTNGFTAIHRIALEMIDLEKISNRYFYECDMLFRLSLIRAVVKDIPMDAKYGNESSSLSIINVIFDFILRFINRLPKRIFYLYFLRDFNIGSFNILVGMVLLVLGFTSGTYYWVNGYLHGEFVSSGRVMLSALPIIIGTEFIISAIHYDLNNTPSLPLVELFNA